MKHVINWRVTYFWMKVEILNIFALDFSGVVSTASGRIWERVDRTHSGKGLIK